MRKPCERCGANRRHKEPHQCIEWLIARLNEYRQDSGYAVATRWRDKCLKAEAAKFFLCAIMTSLLDAPSVKMMGFARASAAKMAYNAAEAGAEVGNMAANIMAQEVETWEKSQS